MKIVLINNMLNNKICFIYILLFFSVQVKSGTFRPGKIWLDTDGNTIEAHGGGIMKQGDTYYWYGENHALGEGNKTGISCYSSTDLYTWKNEGVVFPKDSLPVEFQDTGVCERPKVIFNEKTKKYVMWMHLDHTNYTAAMAGIAVSDSPTGKFTFLGSQRPISFDYGYPTRERINGFSSHEKELGNTYRDMTLFKDDDGKAYVIYSSEENVTLYCTRLNDTFTDIERPLIKGKTWERIIVNQSREAPAIFKYKGKFYIISSGTSGWLPNAAQIAEAESIFGPWKTIGNPCVGIKSETTFDSQSTFVLPAPGKNDGSFIYMGDQWNGEQLEKSTYVWLPFKMNNFGGMKMVFLEKWDLSVFDQNEEDLKAPVIKEKALNLFEWQPVLNANGYNIFKNGHFISFTSNTQFEIPEEFGGLVFNYSVIAWKVNGQMSKPSNLITKEWKISKVGYLSDLLEESSTQGWGFLQKNKSLQSHKINIGGNEYHKGLGTHAPSEIIYRICGNYSKFSAFVGVDYFAMPNKSASVQFEVWGDGILLYQSNILRAENHAVEVNVNITGINELKLVVNDGGNGYAWDHADWANARIIR